MALSKTIHVPHLGGIDVGYRVSGSGIDASKPTVVLINSMCTTASLYDVQFNDQALTDAVNLLAVEPLGHGATATTSKLEQFTYWDSAVMALQVMDALNVPKAFALGTSQGGWMVVRMALLAPERVCSFFHLRSTVFSTPAPKFTRPRLKIILLPLQGFGLAVFYIYIYIQYSVLQLIPCERLNKLTGYMFLGGTLDSGCAPPRHINGLRVSNVS